MPIKHLGEIQTDHNTFHTDQNYNYKHTTNNNNNNKLRTE